MEEKYIFKSTEFVSNDFLNKLNNNYDIKEITFELDHEINEKKEYNCTLDNVKNEIILNIMNECTTYIENKLVLKNNFFNYKKYINNNNVSINLYQVKGFDTPLDEIYDHEDELKEYITCTIILKYNEFDINFKNMGLFKSNILSNYFRNEQEVKKYFIDWTETNEDVYKINVMTTIIHHRVLQINKKNIDDIGTIIY